MNSSLRTENVTEPGAVMNLGERYKHNGMKPSVPMIIEIVVYSFIFLLHGAAMLGVPEGIPVAILLIVVLILRPSCGLRSIKNPAFLLLVSLGIASAVLAPTETIRNWLSLVQFCAGLLLGFVVFDYWRSMPVLQSHDKLAKRLAWYAILTSAAAIFTGLGNLAFARLMVGGAAAFIVATTRWRSVAVVAIGMAIAAAGSSDSKAVYVSVLALLLIGLLRRVASTRRPFLKLNLSILLIVIGGAVFATINFLSPSRVADVVNPNESISTLARAGLALAGVNATLDHPWLGVGPAGLNISENFDQYYSDELLQDLISRGSTRSHGQSYGAGYASGTHNMFLDLSSAYGVPMALLIAVGVVRGVIRAKRAGLTIVELIGITMLIQGLGWQYSASPVGMAFVGLVLALGLLHIGDFRSDPAFGFKTTSVQL